MCSQISRLICHNCSNHSASNRSSQQSVCLSAFCLLINSSMIAIAYQVQEVRTPRKTTIDTSSCEWPKTKTFSISYVFFFSLNLGAIRVKNDRCHSAAGSSFAKYSLAPSHFYLLESFVSSVSHEFRDTRDKFSARVDTLIIFWIQLALHRLHYTRAHRTHGEKVNVTDYIGTIVRQTDSVQSLLCHIRCVFVCVCVCHAVSHTTQNNLHEVHTFHEKSKFEATVRCTLDVDKE